MSKKIQKHHYAVIDGVMIKSVTGMTRKGEVIFMNDTIWERSYNKMHQLELPEEDGKPYVQCKRASIDANVWYDTVMGGAINALNEKQKD